MNLVVCGSSGFLGSHVIRAARSRGHSVTALGRRAGAKSDGSCLPGIDFANLNEWDLLGKILCDAVIYVAGKAHVHREDASSEAEFWRSNVTGVSNALRFARETGARRFILASSISVYDWSAVHSKAEEATTNPSSRYGKSKLAGEAVCSDSNDLEVIILRLATLFGRGDVGNIYRMGRAIRSGKFFIPGKPESRKSLLPVDLAAEAVIGFIENGGGGNRVFNVALPEAPTLHEVCCAFRDHCEFGEIKTLGLRSSVVAGWLGDFASWIWRGFPFNSAVRNKMSQSTVVETKRLYSTLGNLRPKPFYQWMRDYADYYRNA